MDPDTPSESGLAEIVTSALREDLGEGGDITSDAVVPPGQHATAHLVAREKLVAAGLGVAREVFLQLDPSLSFTAHCRDGEVCDPGRRMATVSGNARAILRGERTALNFLMRMCGIATAAQGAVREVQGSGTTILDTRKTAPGLRALDKQAVAAGGAENHRMGLHDAAIIKDTHLAVAGGIARAIGRCRKAGIPAEKITAEVRTLEQLEEAIQAGAGRALLDNMEPDLLREAVRRAGDRIVLEASGGLRPGRLRPVAETGVAFLSLGWLTHSAPAADVAMEMERKP